MHFGSYGVYAHGSDRSTPGLQIPIHYRQVNKPKTQNVKYLNKNNPTRLAAIRISTKPTNNGATNECRNP